jgi:hypothetical protein
VSIVRRRMLGIDGEAWCSISFWEGKMVQVDDGW